MDWVDFVTGCMFPRPLNDILLQDRENMNESLCIFTSYYL